MLIDDIIDILGRENGSLIDALMKTKILLHNIGHKELSGWVNNELNGYPDGEEIPPYRIIPSQVLANVSNITWQATSHPIPLGHLEPEKRANLENSKMGQSLAVLEGLTSDKEGHLIRRLPMELNGILGQSLANDFQIQSAWCEISAHNIKSVMVNVRSRLLDFLLELRDKIGEGATDANIKEKSSSFDAASLFNHTIFGSNTTIIVGTKRPPAQSWWVQKLSAD